MTDRLVSHDGLTLLTHDGLELVTVDPFAATAPDRRPYRRYVLVIRQAWSDETGSRADVYIGSEGFITLPTDTPASTAIPDGLVEPGNVERAIAPDGRLDGGATATAGYCEIDDTDGARRRQIASVNGQAVELWMATGDAIPAFPVGWRQIGAYIARHILPVGSRLRIALMTRLEQLRARPWSAETFAGDNAGAAGLEGDSDLKGRPRSRFVGQVKGAPMPQVDRTRHIFHVCAPPIADLTVDDVRIRAASVTDTPVEHATLAAFDAASPAPGSLHLYLGSETEDAYAMLGSPPDDQPLLFGSEGSTASDLYPGSVLRRGLERVGSVAESELSPADYDQVDSELPWPIGWWAGAQPTTLGNFIDATTAGWRGAVGQQRNGRIRLYRWRLPTGSVRGHITEDDLLSLDALQPIRRRTTDSGVVPWRVQASWGPNEEVVPLRELDEALDTASEEARFAAEAERLTDWQEAAGRKIRDKEAEEIRLTTRFADEAPAIQVAGEWLDIDSPWLAWFAAEVPVHIAALYDLGDEVTLTHRWYGLAAGVPMVITRIAERHAVGDQRRQAVGTIVMAGRVTG